jgi:23S rRNA (guanosine2251-2'-O)-methyltransferase
MRKLKNDELDRMSVEEFKTSEKLPLVLVLDNVRSMNNVGSAFRTGDAFAIEKVYLCGITAQPPHREINKTALGATESVEWEYAEDTATLCLKLQSEGFEVLAVEQAEGSISLEAFHVSPQKKYALVFGNEVFGVEDAVVEVADACLEIPQFGTKHSLNISVSIGVVLWDLTSKIKFG